MSDPVGFLTALSQALAAMTLYADGHPARERALDAAYRELRDLQGHAPLTTFTFLGDEVLYGQEPLRDLKAWDWGRRLAGAGIQRLELGEAPGREEFDTFLHEVLARLTLSTIDTTEARQLQRSSIRFGEVGLRGESDSTSAPLPTATIQYTLSEEVETLRWLQAEVRERGVVPLAEAEAVVRALAVGMHGERHMILPLLQLRQFDEYTTTHSLNVAVLTMGFAEYLGFPPADVRGFGVAGLLHDIGKIRIPLEVLTKPGKFTDEERALMNRHPVEGARILLDTDETLDLAAVVAYEHHIMLNGGGYPPLHFRRACHRASNVVHLCDVFDALRTNRPYREAWAFPRVLAYLEERAGVEFDPEYVTPFVRMMRESEPRVAVLTAVAAPVA
jgi:putative nucleotidyltransferase with HDIG domain